MSLRSAADDPYRLIVSIIPPGDKGAPGTLLALTQACVRSGHPATDAHCTIDAPPRTLVVCVVAANPCRRSREGGNLASLSRVDDRECNQMQPNATELKVSLRLATPDEANQGHNQGQLAQCVGVSGVPNEATLASFSASPLGVKRANQAK